jgi:hypothetical protein
MSKQRSNRPWAEVLQQWLLAVFPKLAAHNHGVAKGDRGVMSIKIDAQEMEAMLGGAPVLLDPVWVPADEFIRLLRATPSSVTPESIDRWESQLRLMDAKRDVALFLGSKSPDPKGTFFTRFIVTHDGSVPVH